MVDIFVPIKHRDMRLIDFMREFPDEQSCERKCCHYHQSLKAITVMHGSQLPLRYWFITMHLLTSTKKSFSAAELQRRLGHKNYMPIWAMLHKLRNAMGKRDAEYKVCGMVELDEYCYKFNRRYFGDWLFDRLMVAALAYKNDFRYNIA